MDTSEVKTWFDQAFKHMYEGDFASAAACFQHVIDHSADPRARNIAQRDLRWYCFPLDAMVKKLRGTPRPMTFEELFPKTIGTGIPSDPDFASYQQSVMSGLDRVATVCRLDDNLWVHEYHLGVAIQLAIADLRVSGLPITMTELAQGIFVPLGGPTLSSNRQVVGILREKLKIIPDVFLLDNDCVFEQSTLDHCLTTIIRLLEETRKPLQLSLAIDAMPWSRSVKTELRVEALGCWLHTRQDTHLVEVADKWWFIEDLIDLSTASLEHVFEDQATPLQIETIIRLYLFGSLEPIHLLDRFIRTESMRLVSNPTISRVSDDLWLPKETLKTMVAQSIHALLHSSRPVILQDLTRRVFGGGSSQELENCLVSQLRKDNRVIEVSEGAWLHRASIISMIDRAYEALQGQLSISTYELLAACFGTQVEAIQYQGQFVKEFESALQQDDRFMLCLPHNEWRAVPSGDCINNLAYAILYRERRVLSRQQIVELAKYMPHSGSLAFRFESDARFKQTPDGRWMLASWVVINDLAASYLAQSPIPLLADTILRHVCEVYNIDPSQVAFDPENDPRFVSAPFGKWACRSPGKLLSSEMLERLVQLAARAADGVTLDDLVIKSLYDHPESFHNLEQVLLEDGRLINCNGLWYQRARWFYSVTPDDLDRIRSYIIELGYPIPSTVLADACLGRPLGLTDLQARLSASPDFTELGSAGWIVRGLQPETVGRKRQINYPIRSGKYMPTIGPELLARGDDTSEDFVESEKPIEQKVWPGHIRRLTITLTFEDVRDGSIVVTSSMRRLLGDCVELPALQIVDELGNTLSCWHDATNRLLHGFGKWFSNRDLAFGDKIRFSPTEEAGTFHVRVTGERDEQVHLEGVRRSRIQSLLEEARQANLSYHDLMIKVLEYFDVPLNIDDLWAMVSSQRAARKRTLVAIMSCRPYFKSEGGGYWRFDKEEYARMIRELERQVKKLEGENSKLQASIVTLSGQASANAALRNENERLRSNLEVLEQRMRQTSVQMAYLEEQLQARDTTIKQSTEASVSLKNALDTQVGRNRFLDQEVAKHIAELADMKQRVEQADLVAYQAMENNQQTQAALAATLQELAALNTQLQEQRTTISSLEQANSHLLAEAASTNIRLRNLSEIEAQLREHIETMQTALDHDGDILAEAERRNQDLEQDLAQMRAENQRLAHQLADLESLHERVKAGHQEAIAMLEAMKTQVGSMSETEVELRAHVTELEVVIRERDDELVTVTKQNTDLKQSLTQVQVEWQNLAQRLADMTSSRNGLQQEFQQATIDLNSLKAQLDGKFRVETQLRGYLAELQIAMEKTSDELATALRCNNDITHDMENVQAEKQKLAGQLADLGNLHGALKAEFAKAIMVLNTRMGRTACWWAKTRGLELPVRSVIDTQ